MNVGIDLGTTNSALSYIDPVEAADADFPPIHVLPIEQQIDATRTGTLRTLPSFLYLSDPLVVGAYAREQGALVPTRTVHSAKSWLSNSEADRTAKLLPWDSSEEGRIMSPVEASTRYLAHLGQAWHAVTGTALGEQDVVLTVPASFDEEARELTVQAARDAGIDKKLTLVEEPAAAFYAWIAGHLSRSNKELFDGQQVLVCDVGGGTSDFTLVRVNREGDRVEFTRTTVGRHLLLGGDNLDLTISWLAESKLGKSLSLRQRSALRRQCSAAKERLLSESGPQSVDVTVVGAGSGLIAGTLKTTVTRDEVLELALGGFLPACELTDKTTQEKGSVFRELGLPYVSDPAITRHLAEFLQSSPAMDTGVHAILFNGGFFIPAVFRERVRDVVEHWFGRKPLVFESQDLDLAVASGAAYYSYVRATGSGVLVRGGLPRAYYLGVENAVGSSEVHAVCLVPRGTEEGSEIKLEEPKLELLANTPVAFRLYSSLSRTEDKLGELVHFAEGGDMLDPSSDPRLHAPLRAVIRFGKGGERRIPVTVGARLSEVGTLEAWAESQISEHRWRLQFQLRKAAADGANAEAVTGIRSAAVISAEALQSAEALIENVFGARGTGLAPEQLPGRLEAALGLGRMSWPLPTVRALADKLLQLADGRRKNAPHEARWLNLTGFCLRPGFGFPGDEYRIEQARRIYAGGLTFGNQVHCEIDWWIFCGRIAAGFNRNQQADLFQRLSPVLLPKANKRQRMNPSLSREMWRTAASLELLPGQTKVQLGDALLQLAKRGEMIETAVWSLSRLGARKLFSGPVNLVVPPAIAARWAEGLLRLPVSPATLEAAVRIAQVTHDAARDLPPSTLGAVRSACEASPRGFELLRLLSGEEEDLASSGRVFGEELPAGLVLASAPVG